MGSAVGAEVGLIDGSGVGGEAGDIEHDEYHVLLSKYFTSPETNNDLAMNFELIFLNPIYPEYLLLALENASSVTVINGSLLNEIFHELPFVNSIFNK